MNAWNDKKDNCGDEAFKVVTIVQLGQLDTVNSIPELVPAATWRPSEQCHLRGRYRHCVHAGAVVGRTMAMSVTLALWLAAWSQKKEQQKFLAIYQLIALFLSMNHVGAGSLGGRDLPLETSLWMVYATMAATRSAVGRIQKLETSRF
jgi:hypothetical protein